MRALVCACALLASGCLTSKLLGRSISALAGTPKPVAHQLERVERPDVRVAITWLGHATMLIQLDDRFVLADPVLTETVGAGLSRRLVAVGLDPAKLPAVDAVTISHMHVDHLSLASLDLLGDRIHHLVVPTDGVAYLPEYDFPVDEVATWSSLDVAGVRITAVPVSHPGFRYGVDGAWMTKSATAWVLEYHGLTVYVGGDTAYDQEAFVATRKRFPKIDVALLAIAPIEPAKYMRAVHVDAEEAVHEMLDLGAERIVPMHYGTFAHGADTLDSPLVALKAAMAKLGVDESRALVVPIGGQVGLFPR